MNEAVTLEKKKRRFPIAAIIAICLVVLILLAAGGYYFSYVKADSFADEGDFASARQWLILPQLTEKHDGELLAYLYAQEILADEDYAAAAAAFAALGAYKDSAELVPEAEYALAGEYMDAQDYIAAIEVYSRLGDYRKSAEMLLDARFGLGMQTLEDDDPEAAHDIFAELEQAGYEGAKAARQECVYRMALELKEQGELIEAYAEMGKIPGYPSASEGREELRELIYLAGQEAYRNGKHGNALEYFQLITPYKDSELYFPLIQLDSDYGYSVMQFSKRGLMSDEELYNALMENFDFENASQLILSEHGIAKRFLVGKWKSESGWYYFNVDSDDYGTKHNLPRDGYGSGFYIVENGNYYFSVKDGEEADYMLRYTLSVIDQNCLGFYCHSNGKVIIMYRQ